MILNPNKYAEDVLSGKVDVCNYVKLSITRHFDDLERDWEYYFDHDEGMRWVKFMRALVLYEGDLAGNKFKPEAWQDWTFYCCFGWRRKDNNKRRFKYIYIEVPRKNGKTTLTGVAANGHFILDDENSPKVYFVVTKYAQAMEGMTDAIGIADITPSLRRRFNIYKRSISYPAKRGEMIALGGDSKKQDGLNPSFAVIDEFHAHPDDGMFNKIKTAFGMRSQPTVLIITTAGSSRVSPCYFYRKRCIDILEGSSSQDNLFSLIYTLDDGDDWKDPKNWIKANPSWNVMNKIEYKQEAEEAIQFTHAETAFKNLRLNIWTDSHMTWIKADDWVKCAGRVRNVDLKGIPCHAGADFASTTDLNALVLNFPMKDGTRHIKSWFWIPEKKVREREDHVPYWEWKQAGLLGVVGGDAIDHHELSKEILKVLSFYNVKGMSYDKYGIGEAVIQSMIEDGYPTSKLHPLKQQTTQLQGPIRMMEEEILLQRINHEGNPILQWNISNVVLYTDTYGGVKFNKSKNPDKIDGAVALAMSFAEEINSAGDAPIHYFPIRI